MRINSADVEEIVAQARAEQPLIACGVLAGVADRVIAAIPCRNTAEDRSAAFTLEAQSLARAYAQITANEWQMLGVYHSLPARLASGLDRRASYHPWRTLPVLILSLNDPAAPAIRSYDVRHEVQVELPLVIDSDQPDPVQSVRAAFADNPFEGWRVWLALFERALDEGETSALKRLVDELQAGGYELAAGERRRLEELRDAVLYRAGGLAAIWSDRQAVLAATGETSRRAILLFRLGLVHLRQGELALCRIHWSECLSLTASNADPDGAPSAAGDFFQQATAALSALDDVEHTGHPNPYLEMLWRVVEDPQFDPSVELRRFAAAAMASADWRRGRQAVKALADAGDVATIATSFVGATQPVKLAAVSAFARERSPRAEALLLASLGDESPTVRYLAATGLRSASASAAARLTATAETDPNVNVRLASLRALAASGDRQTIAALAAMADDCDVKGESIESTARAAIVAIEKRVAEPS